MDDEARRRETARRLGAPMCERCGNLAVQRVRRHVWTDKTVEILTGGNAGERRLVQVPLLVCRDCETKLDTNESAELKTHRAAIAQMKAETARMKVETERLRRENDAHQRRREAAQQAQIRRDTEAILRPSSRDYLDACSKYQDDLKAVLAGR